MKRVDLGAPELNNVINMLNVIAYDIPEDLFMQKIGTGDFLKKLQEQGYVSRDDEGISVNKSLLEDFSFTLTQDEKYKLHLDIINNFYVPKLDDIQIVDYEDLVNNYKLYINLAYHYREISDFDNAINQIAIISKKMQYWGMKDLLIDNLSMFPHDKLSENSLFVKMYLELFTKIVTITSIKYDLNEFKNKFTFLEKARNINFFIYLESKNLEGIFWRIIEKDNAKAILLHQETLELIKRQSNDNNQEIYKIIYGRICENLSFCYQQLGQDKLAEESLENAENYLKDDPYELAKLFYYKLLYKYKEKNKELSWITTLKEINIYLEKYDFPDIERNLFNLLSKIEIERTNQFDNFFKLKCLALDRDLVLDPEYFVTDFISIYNVILANKYKYKDQLVDGLNYLIDFLKSENMEDERIFIELIQIYLRDKDYLSIKNKIQNQGLVNLFEKIIET